MNFRRILLDVDKAVEHPSLLEVAAPIERVPGVQGMDIAVTEIDIETVGTHVTVKGKNIDYEALIKAFESTRAILHSIDELVVGDQLVEQAKRRR
jgi:hypothetical protein